MMVCWGPEGICFFNDACSGIINARVFPSLGTRVSDGKSKLSVLASQILPRVFLGEAVCLRNEALGTAEDIRLPAPTFDLTCSPILDDHDSPAGLLIVVTDASAVVLTRAKLEQTKAQLRERDRKYHALFSSIDIGFCIIAMKFDESGQPVDYRFLEVNPAFTKQTGLIDAEGQWIRTLVPEHEQHWFDIYGHVAMTGEAIRFERPAAALNERWYEVYAFRIGDPGDHQVAILFNDIKERKKSEEALQSAHMELREASDKLKRSNEDLEQFARVAAHDLRTPLRSIVQFSQLLERQQKNADGQNAPELIGHIIESGKRLTQLVEDLLRYSKISQTPFELCDPISARQACLQAKSQLHLLVEETGAQIDEHIPDDVLVTMELSILSQLFQNLIDNAINYHRDGITPHIQITVTAEDDCWKFGVQDNGEGIEQSYASQIFEPFRRLHGPEKSGSGIGLATCMRIVERAGGKLWVESHVGDGSTFYFSLPRA
jgi:PAS domain S-box-containing protein